MQLTCGIWLKSKIYITKKKQTKKFKRLEQNNILMENPVWCFKIMTAASSRNTFSCVIFAWRPGGIHVAVWCCVVFGSTRHEAVEQ
jgi:hypothetical protein